MTVSQKIITISVIALVTIAIRIAPFVLFSGKRQIPEWLRKTVEKMPPFVMLFLVLYSLRNIDFSNPASIVSSFTGVAVTLAVQLMTDNSVISIILGTVVYMILIRFS